MKPPFSLGALSASSHPIAFLLILCDELQEWNRKAYGALDRKKILAETSQVEIGGESLRLHYLTSKGVMSESFGADKAAFLSDVLMISGVFPQGMTLTQTTNSELYMSAILENDKVIGRPLLSNLEAMAKIIHENYNKKREADGLKVDHPTWESLPDTLKYSNIRQARSVYSKLATCGLFISTDPPPDAVEVESFTLEEIESLARDEHDDWVSERLANGWTHGESDSKNKRSPYLIPYTALTEEIKEYDRDAVRNIFPILKRLGLRVYRNSDSYSELLAGE
jgi:hypothetical protein